MKSEHFECTCHSELLQVTVCDDLDDPLYFFVFFSYGHPTQKYSWRSRLNQIFKILRDGTPYADSIILDQNEKNKLLKFLQEN